MLGLGRARRNAKIDRTIKQLGSTGEHGALFPRFEENLAYLKQVFKDDDPIVFHEISAGAMEQVPACLVFCDGLVNSELIANHILRPLLELERPPEGKNLADALAARAFQVNGAKKTRDFNEIILGIT